MTTHTYAIALTWTGNTGSGTSSLRTYSRDHEVAAHELPSIAGSSDPAATRGSITTSRSPPITANHLPHSAVQSLHDVK